MIFSCKFPKTIEIASSDTIVIKDIPIQDVDIAKSTFAILVEGNVTRNAFNIRENFSHFIAYYNTFDKIGFKDAESKSIGLKLVNLNMEDSKGLSYQTNQLYENLTLIVTDAFIDNNGKLNLGEMNRVVTILDKIIINDKVETAEKQVEIRPYPVKVGK